MAYSVTKAAQFHLVKCLAATVGPKIRVNTVLPGLLLTEWVCCENGRLQGYPIPNGSLGTQVFAGAHCRDQGSCCT